MILECMHMDIIIRSTYAHFLRNTISNFLSPHDYNPFIYVSGTQYTHKLEQHMGIYYPLKNSLMVKKGAALCKMAIVWNSCKAQMVAKNGCDGMSHKNLTTWICV